VAQILAFSPKAPNCGTEEKQSERHGFPARFQMMSEDARRFRRRAEECRRLAEIAADPIIGRQLLETAEALEEAANELQST
jgi:hypothetical protein